MRGKTDPPGGPGAPRKVKKGWRSPRVANLFSSEAFFTADGFGPPRIRERGSRPAALQKPAPPPGGGRLPRRHFFKPGRPLFLTAPQIRQRFCERPRRG